MGLFSASNVGGLLLADALEMEITPMGTGVTRTHPEGFWLPSKAAPGPGIPTSWRAVLKGGAALAETWSCKPRRMQCCSAG